LGGCVVDVNGAVSDWYEAGSVSLIVIELEAWKALIAGS